ncbi:MAG: PDZ domain-containing protein [Proteobacteria bacterium]|nr:PDZ domain-containing protein [Pseudomonadota bacterium]
MRSIFFILASLFIVGCGSSDDFGGQTGPVSCSNDEQKQFVWDVMQDWYLWNDLLPAQIDVDDYASPEDLLDALTAYSPDDGSGQPIDKSRGFSFINSAEADAQFFGEGKFEGFGFSYRYEASDDVRLTRVFAGSPAEDGGLKRGQRILELNGRTIAEINAAEGINVVFGTSPLIFTLLSSSGDPLPPVSLAHAIVTIDPVPLTRLIDAGAGHMVGYMELATFISTADPVFDTVFASFQASDVNGTGITDLILDLRYNGGGLVSTAELLGDYLGGGVPIDDVFSETQFNADRAANNTKKLFERLENSLSLSRLLVIATENTASASELVTNSMAPHVAVTIVGATTYGKPVGQSGFVFCEKILRPVTFQTVNADGVGDYFDGLPVECAAADDLNIDVGADADPNMIAALEYINTGSCPVMTLPVGQAKPGFKESVRQLDRRGPSWRQFAGAF